MERMIESRDIKHMACVERIKQLEQENKKLKENYTKLDKVASENVRTLDELEAKRIELEEENKRLEEENKKLNEKVRFLEECLDRKEKLNEKYIKQIDLWKMSREEKDENCYGLAKENEQLKKEIEELKSDLEECKCSFGFENDEVGYRKIEYKRLKKWIKDHCKGYGNLFPEDEMKRQWKKADKKRK